MWIEFDHGRPVLTSYVCLVIQRILKGAGHIQAHTSINSLLLRRNGKHGKRRMLQIKVYELMDYVITLKGVHLMARTR